MSTDRADAALDALLLPIRQGLIDWPSDGVLFLRARHGTPLQERPLPGLLCEQTFKPEADALEHAGLTLVRPSQNGPIQPSMLTLLLPPRQRDEARALMSRALSLTRPGGRVVACVENNAGARSSEADLSQLAGPLQTLSKHKCRVFWTAPLTDQADAPLAREWSALDAVRPIANGRFLSRPGLFAWDRIDTASQLLAEQLPADLSGRAADLGAGFGYLSAELLERCPGIDALDVYEAEYRALELAERNLAAQRSRIALGFHWHDVTIGLPHRYDVIVTNPPFHTQTHTDRPDIGRRFIVVAAQALNPGGRLWLVANRHLPYELVLDENFGTVRTVKQAHGYKIVEAVKMHSR